MAVEGPFCGASCATRAGPEDRRTILFVRQVRVPAFHAKLVAGKVFSVLVVVVVEDFAIVVHPSLKPVFFQSVRTKSFRVERCPQLIPVPSWRQVALFEGEPERANAGKDKEREMQRGHADMVSSTRGILGTHWPGQ